MVIAAFVVSIIALCISGGSLWFSHRQAESSKAMHMIDADRRHEERTPRFKAHIEPVNQGGWHRLRLQLDSSHLLTGLTASLVGAEAVTFTPSQDGVSSSPQASRREAGWDELRYGELATWGVDLQGDLPSEMRIKVECHEAGGKGWSVLVPVGMPLPPPSVASA